MFLKKRNVNFLPQKHFNKITKLYQRRRFMSSSCHVSVIKIDVIATKNCLIIGKDWSH